METNEHKQAGDEIRIYTLKEGQYENPYLKGSQHLSPLDENKQPNQEDILKINLMRLDNNVPVPIENAELTAGDIVALAGDYYTKAGWGLELNISENLSGNEVANSQKTDELHVCRQERSIKTLLNQKISSEETAVFHQAYGDLASENVKKADIDKIYRIENTRYIPFFKSLNSIFQQLVYAFTVKGYGEKLTKNEAHFAPWSVRAYIVGHHTALHTAELAYCFRELATDDNFKPDSPQLSNELKSVLDKIKSDNSPDPGLKNKTDPEIYKELAYRYHALAISQELFAMHFYSDHFAGGHLSRIGILRKTMPEKFGTFGSILINNMHDEDNKRSVEVINPHQPNSNEYLRMHPEDDEAFGDGTYFNKNNDKNSDMLVNGMTNSLGDIARLMQTGKKPEVQNYGGFCFLPEVDSNKPQTQPLLLLGTNGEVYFRSNLKSIKTLAASEYRETIQHPEKNGYEKLTRWKAFVLTFKLRVLGFYYSPTYEPAESQKEKEMTKKTSSEGLIQAPIPTSPVQNPTAEVTGAWRTPASSSPTSPYRFIGNRPSDTPNDSTQNLSASSLDLS
ncbi:MULTISPECIES: hypothetical protein [unclassified Legionella]|uniref:hypothetical protein n=1 Tax=unclassified Legionella TaxID=2622702 RepID=UPI0010541219|nr:MULTISPECIES: hypothetical protein [unclassified Legionella]MDI9817921.1 hypothetical protein [Legionella sp. PL877]